MGNADFGCIRRTILVEYYELPAVVLGLYINGIGTIRSLAEDRKIRILGVGGKSEIGMSSKYLFKGYALNDSGNCSELLSVLGIIRDTYGNAILIPTGSDFWVKFLVDNAEQLAPIRVFYDVNTLDVMRKSYQIELATNLGIPCPSSIEIRNLEQLEEASNVLVSPYVVKPVSRNTKKERFRIKVLTTNTQLIDTLSPLISQGEEYIVSELIPGDDSNLYTFGSYANNGKVIREFQGRKLTQIPSDFGVVGTAESLESIPELRIQSEKLLRSINFTGISQIEYKFDERTNEYKLIEINPRSWMWANLASVCGVNLPLTQYYFETGREDLLRKVGERMVRHRYFINGTSVLYNMIAERKFKSLRILLKSQLSGKASYAIHSFADPKPAIKDTLNKFALLRKIPRRICRKCS